MVVKLIDQVVDLRLCDFGAFEDGLVRQVCDEEGLLGLLVGEGGGLAEDGEDYLGLALGVEFEDVAVFGDAEYLVIDDSGRGEFVGVLDDGPAVLQPLHMHLAVHNIYSIQLHKPIHCIQLHSTTS